jgi:hypothetical protein
MIRILISEVTSSPREVSKVQLVGIEGVEPQKMLFKMEKGDPSSSSMPLSGEDCNEPVAENSVAPMP